MDNKQKTDSKDKEEKIILPVNLQREMMKFFLKTSVPKLAEAEKERQQTSPNQNKAKE